MRTEDPAIQGWLHFQTLKCDAENTSRSRSKRLFTRLSGIRRATRFVVLARSRTGSNYLVSLLRGHPAIKVHGEILQALGDRTPTQAVQLAFRHQPRKFAAVGFKVFYYHPSDHSYEETWDYLLREPFLRVLHLKRRNILRSLISRRIAVETGQWVDNDHTPERAPARPVTMSVVEVRAGLESTQNMVRHGDALFSNHPMISIHYEDLVNSREQVFLELTQFLRVRYVAPQVTLRRQNPEPVAALIKNYDEIKRAFTQTEWAWMFDE